MNEKKALLVVSFGTTHLDTLEKSIAAIERDMAAAFPDRTLRRAFTSGMILQRLAQRDGLVIDSTEEALERLWAEGYRDVLVQPTHMMNGDEYDKLMTQAYPFAERFACLRFGAPLLTGIRDYQCAADALLSCLPDRAEDAAILWMGHGTGHFANAAYALLEYVFHDRGRSDILVGTVEGYPGFPEALRRLKERPGVKRVLLYPLMVVAGDHAKNDLAGDEPDAWRAMLEAEGYAVSCTLRGLGEYPGVRGLFLRHALDALTPGTAE